MTKCIVLRGYEEAKAVKPIEFTHEMSEFEIRPVEGDYRFAPERWDVVELISKGFASKDRVVYDLMFAYDNDRSNGVMYFGHWNDGIV